ncbi:DUF2750 domain-containing protein [Psychrosphaera sp. B3R10]|uniref:DUF2750 domain-containing protein n=1 Tax=Psychrosphaera algicola TaxID=3023714 RepID=A0ABT5FHF9_9GAMM|nr:MULTISPECIES: DUF2750 domain-containing protein [unclassified Psychrosphaera]MBU2882993.1 DUF2750 domain-containing protein [Psychrosphaera sp. I2R16]MBU2991390.1 DUF2750 domain-containing protein [Psychrosphaera sp. B3R10]MDC2890629.1 DUF2750 domain-containing protein [Psychrosphaera sp. G1-22]MDO6720279.1 DUF2750 domain-containing protein [Psychrosphaera sp. 1_MG-2023]
MSDVTAEFFKEVKATQMLWGLHDKANDGWVVADSSNFENAETMPLWSTESMAQKCCVDEWSDFVPTQISVAEWLEFWFEELKEDDILIGLDWEDNGPCEELEVVDFTQEVAEIEAL